MSYDPRNFRWGSSFLQGVSQARDDQRQNALLDLEQRQFGLQEERIRRGFAAEDKSRAARAGFLKEIGLPEQLADDPDLPELAVELLKQKHGQAFPADVQTAMWYVNASPEQRAAFDRTKRAAAQGKLVELGGVQHLIDPTIAPQPFGYPSGGNSLPTMAPYSPVQNAAPQVRPPSVGGGVRPLSSLENEVDAASAIKGAEASAAARGKADEERFAAFVNDGVRAADSVSTLKRGLELLEGVKTGGINALALWASNRLGVTGADEGELSANLGKAVLAQLRRTFGAQFTEREGARLAEIEAGFGKSTAANKRLLERTLEIVEREARRGLHAAEKIGDDFSANEIRNALGTNLTPGAKPKPQTKDDWSIELVQ